MADGTHFTGNMEEIADKIMADFFPTVATEKSPPRPVKQKRAEQVTKPEGSPVKTVRLEEEREKAATEFHMVMQFNKDFTDVKDVTEQASSTWENPLLVVNKDDSDDDGKDITF